MHDTTVTSILVERRLATAVRDDAEALYDLGICYATGTAGVAVDRIAAHKWFNLAAVAGQPAAAGARTEIAEDMTAREIVEAQRQARAWLGTMRLAA